jgi:hypothetical protein
MLPLESMTRVRLTGGRDRSNTSSGTALAKTVASTAVKVSALAGRPLGCSHLRVRESEDGVEGTGTGGAVFFVPAILPVSEVDEDCWSVKGRF